MIDMIGNFYRFIGDLLQPLVAPRNRLAQLNADDGSTGSHGLAHLDDLAARALTAVFGMDAEGRIRKETARCVVEKLGLIGGDEDGYGFELVGGPEDELLRAEEIVGGAEEEDGPQQRVELLRQAFMVFDEDGNGFIEAVEVKRVLECLGLAKGLDMGEFERMVEMADLNFDGKVDFDEFELMMGEKHK
ncbi:uncharacterized protein LOC131256098 [Magnolia sinica]|uniref:uncharacterized protein LOC131256098 n=1 Tax=Magnolia sinica TaxID=86752 RepID=UPI0026586879|nr:uncharacterized protein LOC131256098 [Magnolia sinica]